MDLTYLSDVAGKMKKSENFRMALGLSAVVVAGLGAAALIICAAKADKDMRENNKVMNFAGTLKDTIQKRADTVKHSTAVTAEEVCKVLDAVHGKIEGAKRDIADGGLKVIRDINETIENVSAEIKGKK